MAEQDSRSLVASEEVSHLNYVQLQADVNNPLLSNEDRDGYTSASRRISKGIVVAVIAVVNVVATVLMTVSLPVYAQTMVAVGGDPFVVLLVSALFFPVIFFLMVLVIKLTINRHMKFMSEASWKILILIGVLTTLNGVLVVFAADRTPPYLQGILSSTVIPYTVVCRFLLLRKGISARRLGCVVIVLIGVFISLEPQIWGLKGSGVTGEGSSAGVAGVIWPLVFAIGFLPLGISNVISERELQGQSDSLTFVMWTSAFQVLTILVLFWVDLIPQFGRAHSIGDFGESLRKGLHCCFSTSASCDGLPGKAWLFIIGYCFSNLFQFLLIEYAEGAVYAVVVQSMVAPLATLFMMLFSINEEKSFYWDPQFNITTAFTLVGLVIIVPAVFVYKYFSGQDKRISEEERIRETSTPYARLSGFTT